MSSRYDIRRRRESFVLRTQGGGPGVIADLGRVAIVHDYLTQRGGAERVALAMMRAFPDAEFHTSLYEPGATYPEFIGHRIHTLPINQIRPLRRHHRAALPLLAPSFSARSIDADIVICSSSGWAHGIRTRGRKLVYCYAVARWLYQPNAYVGSAERSGRARTAVAALAILRRPLLRWDRNAARSADMYIATSRAVQKQILDAYGIEAQLLPPPVDDMSTHSSAAIGGVEPGYLLCVSRLLPYKNVDVLLEVMRKLPKDRLVVAGGGPDLAKLRAAAPPNVRLLGTVSDAELVWLYQNCRSVVAPSYEDFGLVPVEAALFGKATAALAWGGFLDTVIDGETGVLFPTPAPDDVIHAVNALDSVHISSQALRHQGARFGSNAFVAKLVTLARTVL